MTHHILVVDDEPDVESLLSQHFRREIRKGEYVFSFVRNGEEALSLLRSTASSHRSINPEPKDPETKDTRPDDAAPASTLAEIDMVLTDINMPVMDGLTLLLNINKLEHAPKTVIVSAYGDMANIRKAMNEGAFDFITKPIQRRDLDLTIKKTLEAVSKEKACIEQLERAKLQLVQSEKMSALGQMVAGIAHEINNPVNFIYGNLQPARDYTQDMQELLELYQRSYPEPSADIQALLEEIDIDFITQDLNKVLDSLSTGAARIRDIVLSLRNFSRLDEATQKAVNIHEGVESTLLILNSRIQTSPSNIVIEKAYGELPLIDCYPSQLNQVLMNLIANAIDALEACSDRPATEDSLPRENKIQISTEVIDPDWIRVAIADNGVGIEKDAIAKLFDPFFTTKPVGKGTGLGLSISYQIIVEKHRGRLYCQSNPGRGTQFFVEIPVSS